MKTPNTINGGKWFRWVVGGLLLAFAFVIWGMWQNHGESVAVIGNTVKTHGERLSVLEESREEMLRRLQRIEDNTDRILRR